MNYVLFAMLQMFAGAGDVVTGTEGYTNAGTGVVTAFDSHNTMSPTMKTYYDTELLENTRKKLMYGQFGNKKPLPRGKGKTIEWRKWNTFPDAKRLQEAVIPTGEKFGMSYITASIAQYGLYTAISDQLELHALDDTILGATEEMSASAASTGESLITAGLMTGTNVMYCDVINPSTGAYVSTPTSSGGLYWDTANSRVAPLTPDMINKAATKLKKDKATPIGNEYVAVVHPSVSEDVRNAKGWIDAQIYANPENLYNGEIGKLHGVRFIENPDAPVIKAPDLASDTRTLLVNNTSGYTGAITSLAFDGSSAGVEADALVGRVIEINGVTALVTDNTATTITFASTNFGTVADNAVIYPGEGAQGGKAAYPTWFFGMDAFGTIDPEGGGMEMITKPKEEAGGPLNQFSTIGYKMETGFAILYPERCLRVMSASSYSGVDG